MELIRHLSCAAGLITVRRPPSLVMATSVLAIWSIHLSAQRATSPSTDRRDQKLPVRTPVVLNQYQSLPLRFEPNRGQADGRVKFLSRYGTHTLFLTSTQAVLALHET